MAKAAELPQHVVEFVELSKEYLRQETITPAKRLGRYAAFGVGAALAYAFGAFLLSVAGVRWLVDLLPDGPNWSALAYVVGGLVLAAVAGAIAALTPRSTRRR